MKTVIVSEMRNMPGTREWVMVEKGEALFHGFCSDYEEFENGAGNYSAAIVEWPNGKIELVRADRIRFVTPNAKGQRGAACGASAAPTGCASNGNHNERTEK